MLELFRPNEFVDSVPEIDLPALKAKGFSSLMLDLDNTLLPWKDSVVPESVAAWVEQAKALGYGLCIVSNTHNPRRLHKIASRLGIPCVHGALKPRKHGFLKAIGMLSCEASGSVVVGDQLLTDILGGNLCGMYTILVRPMHRREFVGTKLSRLVEKGIFALLRRTAGAGTNRGQNQSQTRDTK